MTPEQLKALVKHHDYQAVFYGGEATLAGRDHVRWAAEFRAMAEERGEEQKRLADAVAAVKLLVPFVTGYRLMAKDWKDCPVSPGSSMSKAVAAGEAVLARATVVLARRQRMDRECDARTAGQERKGS